MLAPAIAAEGEVSGTVFQDANNNGAQDSGETGIEGVEVSAFGPAGADLGTVTTAADGTYVLGYDTEGDETDIRLEFEQPEGLVPARAGVEGANSGSTVQFVSSGEEANVGFAPPDAFNLEGTDVSWVEQYSPIVAGSGEWVDPSTQRTIGTVPFDASGDQMGTSAEATADQTGSIWGLANLDTDHLATSALFKRHSVVGPGGLGAIYLTEMGGEPNATPFVTIPDAGEDPRPEGAAEADSGYNWAQDEVAYEPVGKIGLGGLAATPEFDALYSVNLNDKNLYRVPVSWENGTPSAGTPEALALPVDLPGADVQCETADVRPFGVTYEQGSVWVSLTCAGPDPHGYIYELTPEGELVDEAPALELDFEEQRGTASNNTSRLRRTPFPGRARSGSSLSR